MGVHLTMQLTFTALELKNFERNQKNNMKKKINKYLQNANIICGFFCIGFVDLILKGRGSLDYTNLFSPNEHENNAKIVLKYFQ